MKWILSLIDGPIISNTAGTVVGFVAAWFASMHAPISMAAQAALIVGVKELIAKGIQIGSAYHGNAVTSTIAANAHPPTE